MGLYGTFKRCDLTTVLIIYIECTTPLKDTCELEFDRSNVSGLLAQC